MSVLKFFLRDFNSDKTFNWFFVLCCSLGLVGLLLVESFKGGVEEKVSRNAKNFIAGDLSISARRTFDESEIKKIDNYLQEKNIESALWLETYSLVTKIDSQNDHSKLADLNFVSAEFPYYGSVTLEGTGEKKTGEWSELHEKPSAWVSRDLAWELELKLGDKLKVGESEFEVTAIILEDQFSSFRGFNLAPKIFLSHSYLKETQLIKFGSTASTAYVLKASGDVKVFKDDLRKIFPDKSIKIVTPEESSQQISRSLGLLGDYLSLITLVTYLLSLVGLYYFTQHFLSKRLKVFSIYKSLGIKIVTLFKVNFLHLVTLTLTAVLISTLSVYLLLSTLQNFFSKLSGEELFFVLTYSSVLKIIFLSLGGSLLALGPLFWGALKIKVQAVFQDLPSELGKLKILYYAPFFLYVIGLSIYLAKSFRVGGFFLLGTISLIFLSAAFFKTLSLFLEKIVSKFNFISRQSIKTLTRYFNSSYTIFLCLMVGTSLVTFIIQLESSLKEEFTQSNLDKRPELFMFDLQDTQEAEFKALKEKNQWVMNSFSPMIRGRLVKINEELVQKMDKEEEGFETREDDAEERMRNRGVNLSYRSELSWSEKIVKGRFNSNKCIDVELGKCEISLEESYARRLGAKIGDTLTFDISGIEIKGVVTSLRKVKWTSFEPNFFILFQEGVLEEAPKTFLGSFKVKTTEDKRAIFKEMSKNFPTVSLLEVSEVVRKISKVFDLMASAIKFISLLSLFVAFVVLIAVSFNHLELRKREMTLFHMLGLKAHRIKSIYQREFIILIVSCSLLAILFGSLLTTLLMYFIFESEAILKLPLIISVIVTLSLLLYGIVSIRVRKLTTVKSLF